MTLDDLLVLDAETYREVFKGSPMKRAKLSGLKRNAVVAMGNSGDVNHVERLLMALTRGEPELRGHAAWALGRIGGELAARGLEDATTEERDAVVRQEIALARESLGGSS